MEAASPTRAEVASSRNADPPGVSRECLDEESGQLRDGTVVRLRRARASDRAHVLDFLTHMSQDSLELRYLSPWRRESVASEILSSTDLARRYSLLLEVADPGQEQIIGHGEYVRVADHPNRAEVAFLIADACQGQGAATILLWGLARRAREAGIRRFEAIVQSDNRPMIDVFVDSGFPCSISWHGGEGAVLVDIAHEPSVAIAIRDASPRTPLLPA